MVTEIIQGWVFFLFYKNHCYCLDRIALVKQLWCTHYIKLQGKYGKFFQFFHIVLLPLLVCGYGIMKISFLKHGEEVALQNIVNAVKEMKKTSCRELV